MFDRNVLAFPHPCLISTPFEFQSGDVASKAEVALMDDVHDAISDLVELIKTYQSKNKLSKVLMSTLFKQ